MHFRDFPNTAGGTAHASAEGRQLYNRGLTIKKSEMIFKKSVIKEAITVRIG